MTAVSLPPCSPRCPPGGEAGAPLHDLRHTCAALLIATGAHPKLISTRLGHSSIAITMDRYGHLLPALDEAATAGLEAAYLAAAPSPAALRLT